jgi:hypothetical protein
MVAAIAGGAAAQDVPQNALKDAYFGNLHVHTSYSFDGYLSASRL